MLFATVDDDTRLLGQVSLPTRHIWMLAEDPWVLHLNALSKHHFKQQG